MITHSQNYSDNAMQLTCTLKANPLATAVTDGYGMAITERHGYPERGQVLGHADISTIPQQTVDHPAEKAEPSAPTAPPRVSVVIPTLNEARNLAHVFAALPAGLHEVILVDGHSVDGTPDVARRLRPDVRVVNQTRKGKGNALACGFAAATGDIIVMIDADGSTDPTEIPRFVEALTSGADFAKGSRFAPGAGSSDITPLRRLGNKVLGLAVNVIYGTRYSDLCYGYNAFWARHAPAFGLQANSPGQRKVWGDGFEIETVLNLRASAAGLAITEVPSFEHARIHGVSNLHTLRDGQRVLRTILTEWRRP
jgi:glycosyltransferase involved in cell wall biosynthesis